MGGASAMIPRHFRYADDGFGNLVKLSFGQLLAVFNVCYPDFEDDI